MSPEPRLLAAALALSGLAMTADTAAASPDTRYRPLEIEQTADPVFPVGLMYQGYHSGTAVVLVQVDAVGRLVDALATSYTHPAFARSAVDAVRRWKFEAARLDGRPIGITQEIQFSFKQQGTVLVMETPGESLSSLVGRMFPETTPAFRAYAINEIDANLSPTRVVHPNYPKSLAEKGVGGTVVVCYFVDEQGRVRMPVVTNEADPVLSALAIDALGSWRFAPPTRKGEPVLVRVRQSIVFNAKRGPY